MSALPLPWLVLGGTSCMADRSAFILTCSAKAAEAPSRATVAMPLNRILLFTGASLCLRRDGNYMSSTPPAPRYSRGIGHPAADEYTQREGWTHGRRRFTCVPSRSLRSG